MDVHHGNRRDWALCGWIVLAGTTSLFGHAAPGPTIVVGQAVDVRPGRTALLAIEAAGDDTRKVQLTVMADNPPDWLTPATWTARPSPNPRLEIELSPPPDAAPGEFTTRARR